MVSVVVAVGILLVLIYIYLHIHYKYWQKRNVPGPIPNYLVGNLWNQIIFKQSQGEIFTDIYNKFQNYPFVGVFRIYSPALLIRDPSLVKDILIKDFSSFQDHDLDVDVKKDRLFGRNPFCLQGNEWKTVRSHISPCFTHSKVKTVFPLLNDGAQSLTDYINRHSDEVEGKDLCRRFTLNNVANCVFGLKGKCLVDGVGSEFQKIANRFLKPGCWAMSYLFLTLVFPPLSKFFSIKYVNKDVEDKLISIVDENLEYREKNNVTRNDYLNILSKIKKTCVDYAFTNVDVTAHAAGFFSDGYETSAAVMSFMLYALAENRDIQTKLRDEIVKNLTPEGDIDYNDLGSMPYLEACFSETLRLYPPVYTLRKRCTKPYKLSENITLEKGTCVILPMYAMQHDPQYFRDPETFDPNRFLGSNKANIIKGTYYPFGEGPRTCIGQRFGIMQVKLGVSKIVQNFEITVNEKTQRLLTFKPTHFVISARGGLWLDFKKL